MALRELICCDVRLGQLAKLLARGKFPSLLSGIAGGFAFVSAAAADPVEFDVDGKASLVAGVSGGDAAGDIDAELRVTGSTVFASGLEVGAVLETRLDGQQPGRIYGGGRYSSFLIGGGRGLGPNNNSDLFLQGAYAYARGAFGEFIVGKDHGVARTLAVKSPTIFQSFNVNDWRTDLSELNDVHTVNDVSGNATKISYLPPANFLGGPLGSLRFGVSYSPQLSNCSENNCTPEERLLISPEAMLRNELSSWDDAIEAALYYQKGLRVSAKDELLIGFGASYVSADENSLEPTPVFGDYEAMSLGLNLGYRGITIGGSVKTTNAGLSEGENDNYLAFDAGVTYRTGEDAGDWGIMLGYGRSEADIIGPNLVNPSLFQDTQTAQAGVTYHVAPGITVGAAAQFTESRNSIAGSGDEEAATVVIESSIRF